MKIAIITAGTLPVPAVRGGAVETLVEFYLEHNACTRLHDITVYSIHDTRAAALLKGREGAFRFYPTDGFWYKVRRKVYSLTHPGMYYDAHIEYFLVNTLKDVADGKYDVIVVENRPGFVLPLSRATEAPIILHLHNDLLNSGTRLGSDILSACKGVVTVSDYIKRRVETIGAAAAGKVLTVKNAIDVKAFTRGAGARQHPGGQGGEPFRIVYIGRLVPEKGLLEAIDAVAALDDLDLQLVVIGNSIYGEGIIDTDYVRELKAAAGRVEGRVVFTGFVPYSEVPERLHEADMALLLSMWEEPAGLTVIECMAAGLPVVTTRAGGIPEYADDACAIFVDRRNAVAEAAEAVRKLYNDKALRTKLSMAGQHRSGMFTKERYAEEFFEAVATLCH